MTTPDPLLSVYRRHDITMVRGEGCALFDSNEQRYLDFSSGIGVNSLGHSHPKLVAAIAEQAGKLMHCSNAFRNPGLEKLAARLVEKTFADKVFFCSSGTEAVEAGIKLIRRFHYSANAPHRVRIITFTGGFHGRTMAAISAGGNEIARAGYAPLLDGFDRVTFNDLAAVEKAITPQTAGILLEPIQGEGGVRVASTEFLQGLRKLSDKHGLLLMFDEVQCGTGRTGALYAHQQMGVEPDLMSIAKGIGGGFPLGGLLANTKAAACMIPGSHGSTYGGNPLAMAAGNAVLDVMDAPGFFEHVSAMGKLLRQGLEGLIESYQGIFSEVRGFGLMSGIKCLIDHKQLANQLMQNGLIVAPTAEDQVLRIFPPLIVSEAELREALDIIARTCDTNPFSK